MKKNLIFCLIALVIISLLVIGCSKTKTTSTDISVAIVYSTGGLGDKSFNDSAHKGILRAAEDLGIEYSYVEPGNYLEDAEAALEDFADKGFDLVIGVGYEMSESIVRIAMEYPHIKFAIVDGELEFIPENVVNLVFTEQEGAFLAGALAALVSKSNTIGFLGGADAPLIHRFEGGFLDGIRYIKNIIHDIKEGNIKPIQEKEFEIQPDGVSLADLVEIIGKKIDNYSSEVKTIINYAGSYNNPSAGKNIALDMIENGADVIFHASGATGAGLFEAAQEKGIYAIGVDSNQNYQAPGQIIASMLKRIDVAVYNVIKDVQDGNYRGQTEKIFGLREGGIDLTDLVNIDAEEQAAFESKEITKSDLEKIRKMKQNVTASHAKVIEILKTEFFGGNIIVPDWMQGKPE